MCLAVLACTTAGVSAQDRDFLDFSDLMTPRCEVAGLSVAPPPGWINVPIDAGDPEIRGCQMMLRFPVKP